MNALTFSGFCVHSMVFMMLAGCLQVSITLTVNFRKRSSVIDGSQLRDLSVGNVNPILSTPTKTFLRMLISYLEQYVHAKNGHSVLSLFCTNCQFCGYRMCSRAQVEKTSLQFWMYSTCIFRNRNVLLQSNCV